MFIGKLYSLDLIIKLFKFDPRPDIKTQAFFYHLIALVRLIFFLPFEIYPMT